MTFTLHREGDQAVIRVKDEGQGIEPAMLPRIFDLFVQGDQSPARSEGGLGDRPDPAEVAVELHHGRVGHTAKAGRGSTLHRGPAAGALSALRVDIRLRLAGRLVVLVEGYQIDARR